MKAFHQNYFNGEWCFNPVYMLTIRLLKFEPHLAIVIALSYVLTIAKVYI